MKRIKQFFIILSLLTLLVGCKDNPKGNPDNEKGQWVEKNDELVLIGLTRVEDNNGKCGYINEKGEVVIPCQWKFAEGSIKGYMMVSSFNPSLDESSDGPLTFDY